MAKENSITPVAPEEPTYEAAEIAANAQRLFGCSTDMATAALAFNRVTCCTIEKARVIIKTFAERKVK